MKESRHRDLSGLLSILHLCYFSHDTSKRSALTKEIILESLKAKFNILPKLEPIELEKINKPEPIEPEFIAGLFDGDGSLNFSFSNIRRRVVSNFTIVQPKEDTSVLDEIQIYFSCGKVYSVSDKMSRYQIENSTLLLKFVVPFLNKVNLNTIKQEYTESCIQAWEILSEKGIKSDENLRKVVDLVYNLNLQGKSRKVPSHIYLKKALGF